MKIENDLQAINNTLWITWEKQIRNRSMAEMLGIPLCELVVNKAAIIRYFKCIYHTIYYLMKKKPKIIFVQNPSLILNYLVILLRYIMKYKIVSDAHCAGIISFKKNSLTQLLLDYCNKTVDYVIVTNSDHMNYVNSLGGKALICEDPLPDISQYDTKKQTSEKAILFICSYDVDEPYEAVFEAAKLLSREGYAFYASGNYKKKSICVERYEYVRFLGYIEESKFYEMIYNCAVILDLTESENCLVCGGYEAMAAEKPFVTSNTKCLKQYFKEAAVYTDHSPESIAIAIRHAYDNRNLLKENIIKWKTYVLQRQKERHDSIVGAISQNKGYVSSNGKGLNE